jgi:TonB family protein
LASENRSGETDGEAPVALRRFNGLGGCMVDGDLEQMRRERRARRRALGISTLLEAVAVVAIVAIPFLGKGERIALANVTPIPPYYHRGGAVREHVVTEPRPAGGRPAFCFLCPDTRPVAPAAGRNGAASTPEEPTGELLGAGPGAPCSGCIPIGNAPPPERPAADPPPAKLLRITHLDPAMITTRVEPSYPVLPKQMRLEGRVELRAVISTEGRIESLEAVGGDALFFRSAMDAVRLWRYKPTMLNGRAVEVETYITIIYTLEK